jgi:hypothetical protein
VVAREPHPGARLVDQVDRFVGKEPVGQVSRGELRSGTQRPPREVDPVVLLVTRCESVQDSDRLLDGGLVDVDPLEAALECPVPLEVAVLLVGRRSHAPELAGLEERLQHARGVDGCPLSGARAENRVDLVDEQDRLRPLLHRSDERLESRLEVAAVTRPREQRPHVDGEDLRPLEHLGHAPLVDAEREPLGDGGLADPGLPDEHRVVLGPPRQHVDRPLDLRVAPDERVDLSPRGALGQVRRERGQRVGDRLLVVLEHGGAAIRIRLRLFVARRELRDPVRHVPQHVETRDPLPAEQGDGVRVGLLEDRRDEIARLHLLLLRAFRLADRPLKHAVKREGLLRLARVLLGALLDVLLEEALELPLEPCDARTGVAKNLGSALVVKQRVEQVLDREVRVPLRHRLAKGRLQRQLQLPVDLAHSGSTPPRSG